MKNFATRVGVLINCLKLYKTRTEKMKWHYILLLGIVEHISGEEHDRVRRQFSVSPIQPGFLCRPAVCPQDCGAQFFLDPQTGCRKCQCDPNDNTNPFVTPGPPQCPPADCPQDCAAQFFRDPQTGCRQCRCDPNDTTNPFMTPGVPQCPPAPCPQDCAAQFFRDPQTGCQRCRCDPNDTTNPFVIPGPPQCPPANCPFDCGVQFFRDPQTGCRRCRCDPNDNTNPFVQCPPADCPQDCETQFFLDPQTGCRKCRCNPNTTTNQCQARSKCKNANGVCKKACAAGEEQLKERRACTGRRCKCCVKTSVTVCNPNPPCPQDCATVFITDPQTGCRNCRCRPSTAGPIPYYVWQANHYKRPIKHYKRPIYKIAWIPC